MNQKKNKILMYMHAGSGNHGCEAIVNSLCHLLPKEAWDISVLTNDQQEDERYSLGQICTLLQEKKLQEHFLTHVCYYLYRKITGDAESFLAYRYQKAGELSSYDLALSIGGDNYCYDNMQNDLRLANRLFHQKGIKTLLFGCSIEPALLQREDIRQDLASYTHIVSRESITTAALQEAGITQVTQLPDPAFTLEGVYRELPEGFVEGETVGINVSPMIMDYEGEGKQGIVWQNYLALMTFILQETNLSIALIPHVVWERNDDQVPIRKLYASFCDDYPGRICMIPDGTCQELKGDIARCRFFVGARTHGTIAAYSSCVPTLVAGYSVKSLGIAKDLFGEAEQYVVDVRALQEEQALVKEFQKLMENENLIRRHLSEKIPQYIAPIQDLQKRMKKWVE